MIELKDLSYVRLGVSDLEDAESFATKGLGLQVGERTAKSFTCDRTTGPHALLFRRRSRRSNRGFEVDDEGKLAAASTRWTHWTPVHIGTHGMLSAQGQGVHRFKDPTGNRIELVVRPSEAGSDISRPATPASPDSAMSACSPRPGARRAVLDPGLQCRVSDRIGDIALMR